MLHSERDSPPKPAANTHRVRRWLRRVLSFIVLALIFGTAVNYANQISARAPGPAGFQRGLLHGVLMPIALPNLLIGRDVVIYAAENTGRTYKLGYTLGVNGCGALFFGVCFWRVQRWRKRADAGRV